jgi:hypothetical protein
VNPSPVAIFDAPGESRTHGAICNGSAPGTVRMAYRIGASQCVCSSGVECLVANEKVVGAKPTTRSTLPTKLMPRRADSRVPVISVGISTTGGKSPQRIYLCANGCKGRSVRGAVKNFGKISWGCSSISRAPALQAEG